MKKVILFLMIAVSILSAKEQQAVSNKKTIYLKNSTLHKSACVSTQNKFTAPLHVNTLAADQSVRRGMENDLAAILQRMKQIHTPGLQGMRPSLAVRPFLHSQNLQSILSASRNNTARTIHWNEKNGTPAWMQLPASGKLSKRNLDLRSLQMASRDFLQSQASMLMLKNPADELQLIACDQDDLGETHLRYQQVYQGIKVWGADLYLHYNAAGEPKILNGRYAPTPAMVSPAFPLLAKDAVARASAFLGYDAASIRVWQTEKVIYTDGEGRPAAAWHVELGKDIFDDICLFVDAQKGRIIHWYNNLKTGTPRKGSGVDMLGKTRALELYEINGKNYLLNTTKNMFNGTMSDNVSDMSGIILIGDAQNVDPANFEYYYYVSSTATTSWPANAVSLAWTFAQVYDYFKSVHSLTTLDDGTHNITGIVNIGANYNNAFWNGGIKLFCFGNGDGAKFKDMSSAFDIIAHEYGHGVTEYSSNLEYQFQSGALNESFSDFSGVMAEFYVDPGNANWLIGEDCVANTAQYNCLRNLGDPHHAQSMTSDYPSKMSEYYDWPIDQDNGGVHRNSTIPGHAFYLMADKMSREKAEKIIYRAFKHYLTRRSQFVDCRIAAIQASKDLYAGDGTDALVAQAFDEVEVYGDDNTEPDKPYEPVVGDDYILAILDESRELIQIKSDMPYQDGAASALGISSLSKPSVTENGSIIAYIDLDGNVNLYDMQEEENYAVTSDGQWHNISISPKADYIAVTPDPEIMPSVIGLIDMEAEETQMRNLYVPTTSEGAEIIPEYADILDWSVEGGWLIYDCLFTVQDEYGNESDTWGIYLTSATSEAVIPLFQPSAEFAVGNPSFSSTRDNVIAFDVIDYSESYDYPDYYIHTYDLFTGELGFIHQNRNTFGHPSFSPNDQRIVFQDLSDENVSYLSQAAMQADLLNADASTVQDWVHPVGFPVWYAVGTRPGGGGDAVVEEHFDADEFPPEGWLATHLSGAADEGWRNGNVEDHNFSEINPDNLHSALCGYDANANQIDRLFSPAFDIAGSAPAMSFWAGYDSYWTTNYEVKVYITKSSSTDLDEVIWQQKVEGNDGTEEWDWREVEVELKAYTGRENVRICWEYTGQDGDLFALDDVLIYTDATSVEKKEREPDYHLLANYPKPFNGTTQISYSIIKPGRARIEIYDVNGRLIKTLVDEYHAAGYFTQKWHADVSSGLYIYRLISADGLSRGKTVLIK